LRLYLSNGPGFPHDAEVLDGPKDVLLFDAIVAFQIEGRPREVRRVELNSGRGFARRAKGGEGGGHIVQQVAVLREVGLYDEGILVNGTICYGNGTPEAGEQKGNVLERRHPERVVIPTVLKKQV